MVIKRVFNHYLSVQPINEASMSNHPSTKVGLINLPDEHKFTLSSLDFTSYSVTDKYTFTQTGEVSGQALDEILFNLLNSSDEIETEEVSNLVSECKKHRVDLKSSRLLPVVSTMLIQSEINSISVQNTKKQLQANLNVWMAWCKYNNHIPFPASNKSIERFIESQSDEVKINTMKSYIWSIKKIHVSGGIPDPTSTRSIKRSLKAFQEHRVIFWKDSPKQASPMRSEYVTALYRHYEYSHKEHGLHCRDLLVLLLSYDTLLREAELARIDVSHIVDVGSSKAIKVTHTKTSRGVIEYRPISTLTIQVIDTYLALTNRDKTTNGPLLLGHYVNGLVSKRFALIVRSLNFNKRPSSRRHASWGKIDTTHYISTGTIYNIFIKASVILESMGLSDDSILLSGHSGRVGKAKDLKKAGVSNNDIMKAGGWKSLQMVVRYTEDEELTTNTIAKFNNEIADRILKCDVK